MSKKILLSAFILLQALAVFNADAEEQANDGYSVVFNPNKNTTAAIKVTRMELEYFVQSKNKGVKSKIHFFPDLMRRFAA